MKVESAHEEVLPQEVTSEAVATEPASEAGIAEAPSVEDQAAAEFQRLIPLFYKTIEECSNRSLKRVVTALVEYPLHEVPLRWSYPQERQLFEIGMRLFDAKYVIMRAVLSMKAEEVTKVLEETAPPKVEVVMKEEGANNG